MFFWKKNMLRLQSKEGIRRQHKTWSNDKSEREVTTKQHTKLSELFLKPTKEIDTRLCF